MKIQQKITTLASFIIVAMTLLTVYTNYVGKHNTLHDITEKQLSRYNNVFWGLVESEAEALDKLLTVLGSNEALINSFITADRQALLTETKPLFDKIRESFEITHFYFIDTEGTVYLRVHKPEEYGDKLERATYLQARENRKIGSGIEMGKNFFSLRVVKPVYSNNQLVGYFELGQELDHLISEFQNITHAGISMWVSQQYANKHNLNGIISKTNNWYQIISSNSETHTEFMQTLNNSQENRTTN